MLGQRILSQSRYFMTLLLAVMCLDCVCAQETQVSFGVDGHYRVGCWTAVRCSEPFTKIETRDGDGVQVEYVASDLVQSYQWAYAIPGSEAAPAILFGENGIVTTDRFPIQASPSRGPAMIPLGMPWIVAIGDPLGIDRIGANELLNRDPLIAVSKPLEATQFPNSHLGYDGVDMMLVGGSSAEILTTLQDSQQQAIVDWLHDGGRMFVTLGESTPKLLAAAPWLADLLPIDEFTTVKMDPSSVETYTSSQTPLSNFESVKLPKDRGRILILGRTTRRVSAPVAVEYNVGFGRVTVLAADLESDLFEAWPERMDLMTQLTGSILIPNQDKPQQEKSRSTAYADLAGQLRATLDQFSVRRSPGFSVVSLILMALIAAIGPLDYFLINRVLGRPLLGWLTFPIVVIGLSIVLAMQAESSQVPGSEDAPASGGRKVFANRVEVFDFDTLQGVGRGFSASYLYTHNAASLDLKVQDQPELTSIIGPMKQKLTAPFGYPGESYGGIQIAIEDSRLPTYQLPFVQQNSELATSLQGLPLASRSSKGVFTRCWFQPDLPSEVTLANRAGSELLSGELTNPLPLDLLDGLLVFKNWAYQLPTRFPAGDRIESVDQLGQKPFRWQLSRQKALEESATEIQEWDPANHTSPGRVTEMLMFHDAVGGRRYTTLQHDPLAFLDLSHVLADDRCILVGRLSKPLTKIEVKNQESDSSTTLESETLSYVRVVLPVKSVGR